MKLDDLSHQSSQSAPKKPRVLIPLLCGSIALHLLVWWAVAQFPVPPTQAPEALLEIQLSDLPTPATAPKPGATPALRSKTPRVAQAPRAPRRAKTPVTRPTQHATPDAPRREVAPTAPLERSTRAVSETGIVAKKPLEVPQPRNLDPRPQRAPDKITGKTQSNEPLPRPNAGANQRNKNSGDSIQSSDSGREKGKPENPKKGGVVPQNASQNSDKATIKNAGNSTKSDGNGSKSDGNSTTSGGNSTKSGGNSTKSGGNGSNSDENGTNSGGNGTNSGGNGSNSGGNGSNSDDSDKTKDFGDKGRGLFGLGTGPYGIGNEAGTEPRPNTTRNGETSSLPGVGGRRGNGGNQNSQNRRVANGKSNAGGGPFGLGNIVSGGAGEGPRRIVYILDVSYSMEPRFERAKQELRNALGGLQAGESFNIIAVYGNVRPFEQRLVEATPRNIDKGRAFINSLRLSRHTNLERAFETAFAAPGVNVVVLITDGVPTYGLGSPDFSEDGGAKVKPNIGANFGELARRVRELNPSGARIYTVGLTGKNPDGTPDNFEAAELLQRIAADSGGSFVTVRVDATPQPES